ncbi:MAG TPA: site-specific DNA-methyltransferase [Jatrophihabitans sp.]|jgi:DNA modification methylase|uniref:DNA-methyltransferase n=1 Tax=Jatrophihabitans sp. TaxID=1932789 RepID=UPI002EFF972A
MEVRPHLVYRHDRDSQLKITQSCNGMSSIRAGDAFDLIEELEDHSVDLIATSPPYWGLRDYGMAHDESVLEQWRSTGCEDTRVPHYDWYRSAGGRLGREPFPTWYVAHLVEFFNKARPVLKDSASMWVNLGDTYFARWGSIRDGGRQGLASSRGRRRTPSGGYLHDKQLLMIPARFAIAMQDAGWILRNDLIWAKPQVLPRPEKDRLRLSHEHWFHFVLKQKAGRPQYYYDLNSCEPGGLDVVTCPTEPGSSGHSATFPSQLIRPRILSSCPPSGVLLDPFCGTGRAVVEAVRGGRTGIGFELCEPFARVASKAISAAAKSSSTGQDSTALAPAQRRKKAASE